MIGVHTYSHPNIALVSEERAHLEFNATQRLIESITGHSTILFRPPYNADTNPHDAEELVPIKLAQAMGYLTVTEDIDPEDWEEPGVETMLERVKRAECGAAISSCSTMPAATAARPSRSCPRSSTTLRPGATAILPLPETARNPGGTADAGRARQISNP